METKGARILVVDDEEAMVFSIQDYLSTYADCLGATSYEEAISLLVKNQDIAVVISDIRMPNKDGFDLLMWLKEHRPQIKVIMMTAYGSPSVRSLAKQRGAVRYLEKPIDLDELLRVVRQILERKGFSAALKDMELADVLQFLSFANKAARVQILNPLGEKGEIILDGEEILWISTDTKQGEEAFYEIMSWQGGSFEVLPLERGVKTPEEKRLAVPLSYLLLEDARRRDEARIARGERTKGNEGVIQIGKQLARWPERGNGILEFPATPEPKQKAAAQSKRSADLDTSKDIYLTIPLVQAIEVQPLLRDIKRVSLDLDGLLAEIQLQRYSGEARIVTPRGQGHIIFYQGLPLVSSKSRRLTARQAREMMDIPDATLTFYLLGDELAHACISVFQGEKVWAGLTATMFHLEKMLSTLMERNPTGHLCIHKGNGDRHYLFLYQGLPLGVYDLAKHWRPVEIATLWEAPDKIDYYLSGEIESFVTESLAVHTSADLPRFIPIWNELVATIAKKAGKRPVEKSIARCFGGHRGYAVDGTKVHLISAGDEETYHAFKERGRAFLREMATIIGDRWLGEQLRDFRHRHAEIIAHLSLLDLFSPHVG